MVERIPLLALAVNIIMGTGLCVFNLVLETKSTVQLFPNCCQTFTGIFGKHRGKKGKQKKNLGKFLC